MNLLPFDILAYWTPIFTLVLIRISGILVFAPVLGSMAVPMRIKVMLALVLTAAVFPAVLNAGWLEAGLEPNNLFGLGLAVMTELLIGLSMGFALMLMFVGVQVGAEMISQQMALSLGQIFDPLTNISTDVVSQFYLMLTTLIYVLMNGPVILIRALVDTFARIPLMGAQVQRDLVDTFTSILSGAFALGIRIAGPALAAIFLATLAMGFISRTMPQLNILAAGFPLRIGLALVLLIASLGSVCFLLEKEIEMVLSGLGTLFL